jgi:hypothetical protein
MNARATWILLALALALGGYVYVSERHRTSADATNPEVGYAPVRPESVTALELLRSNTVVRVERGSDGWRLTMPVRYRAQGTAVDGFLDALAKLRPRAYIPSTQLETGDTTNRLTAFGFGDNTVTVKLETAEGSPVLFKIGGPTPLGTEFYFQRVGADGVFTADDSFLANLPPTADFWRDRGLFDLGDTKYDRIEIQGKTAFVAEKEAATGAWRLIKPLSARADGGRLEALLNAFQRLRVAAFVSDSPLVDLEPLGLQPPEAELIVGRGTNDLVRLQFGRVPTNAPEFVFVRRLAQSNLVLVPAEAAAVIRLPLANFRDRQLVPSLTGATRLQFRAGDTITVVERRGTNWLVTEPEKFPADRLVVEQVLQQLGGLVIVDFPNDVPANLARYGLAQPAREFVVAAGTNELARIEFGSKDGLDKVFARRADETSVYSTPLAELLRLPETAGQLRDMRFDPTNVVQVDIRQKGRTRSLARAPDGTWSVKAGSAGNLLDVSVNETLYRLGRIESTRYVADPTQFPLLKFPEVDHEVLLRFRPGAEFQTMKLQFGGRNPANNMFALAQFDGDPRSLLFEFPGTLYDDVYRDFSAP